MTVKINLKKAARTVLEEGNYGLNIVVCEQGESQAGKPKIHLEYVPNQEMHPDLGGARLFEEISLQEQAWFRVLALLQAVMGNVEGDDEGDFEFDPEELIGATIGAYIIVDDSYDGTPRNRVQSVFPVEELGSADEAAIGAEAE